MIQQEVAQLEQELAPIKEYERLLNRHIVLDLRKVGSGCHAECDLLLGGISLDVESLSGHSIAHSYLDASQSLALLTWLTENRSWLEYAAKEQAS
ncbi:MAG TPA: hypothetical protein VFA10_17910 [Ktedonobacteraceae bacterium]|nr:hypothetical protein [Ktedonobacteraceae bacterium]